MGIRLYDSVWVVLADNAEPCLVSKDRKNPAVFNVGSYQYDIDGRPVRGHERAPAIVQMHSLQSAREAGLSANYVADAQEGLGRPFARS